MQTLSASLIAHQRSAARVPAILLTAHDRRAGVPLFRWERWYSGSEAASPHAAAIAGDGSLLRARNDAGALYVSRVATPAISSTYSGWSVLQTGLVAGSGVALAARGGEALIAYTRGTTLYLRASADDGSTWGAETAIVNEGVAIGAIALALRTTGDACLFYTQGTSSTLKRLRRTAGTWAGSGTAWSHTADLASISGVAACHDSSDFALLVTGTEATTLHKRCWVVQMGDLGLPANAWSALVSVAESDAASTASFTGPAILALGSELRGAFAQRESGPVANDRAFETAPPAGSGVLTTWCEPAPHEATGAYGLALAAGSGSPARAFATTPSGVWSCLVGQSSDLSARIERLRVRFGPDWARLEAELDDADGALLGATNDVFPGLTTGGDLVFAPGYISNAGAAEYGVTWRFSVDRIRHVSAHGRRVVVLEGSGPFEQAARWHSPQSWQTASGALSRDLIFARIAGRAGLAASAASSPHAPSSGWTSDAPSFVLPQGEDGRAALQRLFATVGDAVRHEDGALAVAGTANSTAEESYGPGAHPIAALELADEPPRWNWARLQGSGRYADVIDPASVYQHGARLETLRLLDASSDGAATAAAAGALGRRLLGRRLGTLVAPFNAGQQLWDLVAVDDPAGGPAPVNYRVIGLGLDYARGPAGGRYDSVIELGAP